MGRSEELVKVDIAIPASAWDALEPLVKNRSLASQLRQKMRAALALPPHQFEELVLRASKSRGVGAMHRYSPELLAEDVARLDKRLIDLEVRVSRAQALRFLAVSIAGEV